MGRHDGRPVAGEHVLDDGTGAVRGFGVGGKVVVLVVLVVAAVGAGALVAPDDVLGRIPWAQQRACPPTTVRVVAEPEIGAAVREIVAPLAGEALEGGSCLRVEVTAQEGDEAAASASILPASAAPQLWIPDSQAWVQKATSWRMRPAATFASSPVVVATSVAAARSLNWMSGRPTWNQALRGPRPAAVPDIATQSDSLAALIALWQTLGKGAAADQAVVNLVVAADRGEVPTAQQALAVARSGSANSPVVPATEQAVAATNATTTAPELAAVYPSEGSPILTYPVVRVLSAPETPVLAAATALVVERLKSPAAPAVAREHGFRAPDLAPATGDGIYDGPVTSLLSPGRAEVDSMIQRVEQIGRPSRILCLLDTSLSMRQPLDDGLRRLDLAAAAARLGANVLPNGASVGAWVFASGFPGGRDYREVAPVLPLGSRSARGETHRGNLIRLTENPDRYLKDGGTSIYDTALAASRRMHQTYDPQAVHGIILLSDGSNEDSTGETLDGLLAELRRVNAGDRQVPFYTAAVGPDADFSALSRVAEASGGHAYRINSAAEGQDALLDGLRRSRDLGNNG